MIDDYKALRAHIKLHGYRASLYRVIYIALIIAGWSVQDARDEAQRAGYRVRLGSTIEREAREWVANAIRERENKRTIKHISIRMG